MIFVFFSVFSLSKKLQTNETILVFGNKANPMFNPLESYGFDFIPFCLDPSAQQSNYIKKIVENDRKSTPIQIKYLQPVNNQQICSIRISPDVLSRYQQILSRSFIYELYIGKLPVWSLVGKFSSNNSLLVYTHFHFILSFRDAHVVEVSLLTEEAQNIALDSALTFSYTVEWVSTNKKYRERFTKYCDNGFFMNKVRYYALINTSVMVLLLTLLVIFVMTRFLGSDFRRFEREAQIMDYENDVSGDKGWKAIHSDVFRVPKFYPFLSGVIGAGAQVLTSIIGFAVSNLIFRLHFKRNSTLINSFIVYSLSAIIGGYISSAFYKRWGGKNWIRNLVFESSIIPSFLLVYKLFVWFFSALNGAKKSIHVGPFVIGFFVLIVAILPLTIFGGILGRNWFLVGELPVRIGLIQKPIPRIPIYLHGIVISFLISVCFSSANAEILFY